MMNLSAGGRGVLVVLCLWPQARVLAQTGVDDDRVSLPSGPGSTDGVGDDVAIDANMGAMGHTVPILLPAGFPGASPSLALAYSSAAASGPVGIGWSLAVPGIERMTSRGVPRYTTNDLFDVAGSELVQVGSDGADLIYRARFENAFIRYRWVGAGAGADGYWIAEYPDGSRGFFGADASGALVAAARLEHPTKGTARYLLSEKVDVYGNSVRYFYDGWDSNVPLLTGIQWVKDSAGAYIYSVELDFETRTDLLSDGTRGFEELLANRVRYIRVKNGAEIIREYVLTYEADTASGGFSRLARVELYGLGGRLTGTRYDVVHSFQYSQALGVACTGAGCSRPVMVQMGSSIAGASNLASGRATLNDMNKDGLPDIVDTTDQGAHVFYFNTLAANASGGFDQDFSAGVPSNAPNGRGSVIQLGGAVQAFDINGDGTSDILNTTTGQYLLNDPATGDWGASSSLSSVAVLQMVDLGNAQFIDLDDDKRVDIITSSSTTTTYYHNEGQTFSSADISPLGVAIQAGNLTQFADMNGDGLNDPVEFQTDGSVRCRLNYGLGDWSPWRSITGLSLNATQRPFADLEDLNGDGISDVIVVDSGQVQYAINRNGEHFDPFVTITSASINGVTIPDRGAGTSVLYMDMNGSGSQDVVWFRPGGVVQYLELFPVRPNLLTRIENGIGGVQKISYTTAAQEAARARAAGRGWAHALSIPMQMVKSVDRYVTLTGNDDGSGLHDVSTLSYWDGFYDGVEKQYRGFERVEDLQDGDAHQEDSATVHVYDVGRVLPHRKGLELIEAVSGSGTAIRETRTEYQDCTMAGVPPPSALLALNRQAVYFPCMTAKETLEKEHLTTPSDWKTLRTEFTYDGYGNVSLEKALGVVGVTGDELYTETSHVVPAAGWLIRLPVRVQVYADPQSANRAVTTTYYDGADFVGLPEGEASKGFVSRVTRKVDAAGRLVTSLRERRDAHGNSIETIDANGTLADPERHRRSYTYDDTGLFLTGTDLHNVDDAGMPYILRRDSLHERNFQKVIELSSWYMVRGGSAVTARDISQVRYDAFGRPTEKYQPGDAADKPSERIAYVLGDPFSRVISERRSVVNGAYDEQVVRCMDGKGRRYQDRTRIGVGQYQVDKFMAFNSRGQEVESYQPYLSTSDQCDASAPVGTLKTVTRYDALARAIEISRPGEGVYGAPVVSRTVFKPLAVEEYDGEDALVGGPHEGTPTVRTLDGLRRVVRIERTVRGAAGLGRASESLAYDGTGRFSGYTDAAGNNHVQTNDLLGRPTSVTNRDFGTITVTYDDEGNITSQADARGVTVQSTYDGLNRIHERFDPAQRDASLVTWLYDVLPTGCALTECTNTAGMLAAQTYAVDLGGGRVEAGMDRFGYDARRRTVFRGRKLGALVDLVTRSVYDNRDRAIQDTFPDSTVISYRHDGADRLTGVTGFVDSMSYTARGQLDTITFSNGARERREYDSLMRLSRLAGDDVGAGVHDLVISRNRDDVITSVVDQVAATARPSLSVTYGLDDWYRNVTTAFLGTAATNMTYDVLDRMTAGPNGTLTYSATGPHQLANAAGLTFGYDAAGQLTARGNDQYGRDERGRLTTVTRNGVTTGRHVFGANGRVVKWAADGTLVIYGDERFEVRDGIAISYVSNGLDRLARKTSTGLAASIYPDVVLDGEITAGDAFVSRGQASSFMTMEHVLAAAASRLLADNEDGKAWFFTDPVGSLISATDEGGAVRGRQAFAPLGATRFTEGFVDWHGFTGQESDETTGFLHMAARDLDPVTGRWDRFDPAFILVTAESMEQLGNATTGYAYVGNQSSTLNDPSGLCPGCGDHGHVDAAPATRSRGVAKTKDEVISPTGGTARSLYGAKEGAWVLAPPPAKPKGALERFASKVLGKSKPKPTPPKTKMSRGMKALEAARSGGDIRAAHGLSRADAPMASAFERSLGAAPKQSRALVEAFERPTTTSSAFDRSLDVGSDVVEFSSAFGD